jgi:hypothetical protein
MHVAGVAIVNEKSAANRDVINDQLQHALNSRIVLEQAKGVLASVGKLDMNTAFTVLRSYARDRGAKVSRGLGLCDQWASPPADAAGGQFESRGHDLDRHETVNASLPARTDARAHPSGPDRAGRRCCTPPTRSQARSSGLLFQGVRSRGHLSESATR